MLGTILLSGLPALAGPEPVSAQAMARLERYGPHSAIYTKLGSGIPALEIRYHSPLEASLEVQSPDGTFALSVDRDHIRFLANETCAKMPIEPMLDAVELIGLGGDAAEGFAARLDYRILPGGQATMDISFGRTDQPVPLAWLADLDSEAAVLSEVGKEWQVSLAGTEWAVSKKTGVLNRMSAGENGLQLDQLTRLPAGPLPPICTDATDPILAAYFSSQYLLPAYIEIVPEVLSAWGGLGEPERAGVRARQEQFWEIYFAAELQPWAAELQGGPWVQQVVTGMSSPESFAQFTASLPESERASARMHWQQYWYADAGNALLSAHVAEVRQAVTTALGSEADVIIGPMESGAVRAAEEAMRPMLTQAVLQGAAAMGAP